MGSATVTPKKIVRPPKARQHHIKLNKCNRRIDWCLYVCVCVSRVKEVMLRDYCATIHPLEPPSSLKREHSHLANVMSPFVHITFIWAGRLLAIYVPPKPIHQRGNSIFICGKYTFQTSETFKSLAILKIVVFVNVYHSLYN